jgi:hypothetical protein
MTGDFDGRTLSVHIPMRLGRTRGRKRILAPDGSELTPPRHPQPDTTLVKALARAWRWQRLLDRGVYASVSEIAEAERISKSYVSRLLRLVLLAPDIVEAILAGTTGPAVGFEQLETGVPMSWEEQRVRLPYGRDCGLAVAGLNSETISYGKPLRGAGINR